jgi:hypothetical protein
MIVSSFRTHTPGILLKPRILYLCPIYLEHTMPNKKELEEIIINKGEMVYKELEEREGRESTTRDIPVESYVYAYLKAIDSAYRYLIDTHKDDKRMGPRLDSLQNRFKIVMEDLWSYYNEKKK